MRFWHAACKLRVKVSLVVNNTKETVRIFRAASLLYVRLYYQARAEAPRMAASDSFSEEKTI